MVPDVNSSLGAVTKPPSFGRPTRLEAVWALFALSIGCFSLATLGGAGLGPAGPLLAIAGNASCGWSWLFARALFRPKGAEAVWPDFVVATLVLTGAAVTLAGSDPVGLAWAPLRIARNVHDLTSSTVLLLALIEPFKGFGAASQTERRFRVFFAVGYGALLAVSVLFLAQAPSDSLIGAWAGAVKVACGVAGVLVASSAVLYRRRRPLSASPKPPRSVGAEDRALAAEIMRALTTDDAFATPSLKVADLARRLRRPEHQITQTITGVLGAANFNRLVNGLRIEAAKAALSDPAARQRSILDIALASGFGSIGPFNRAFKDEVGMTPSAFRALATPSARPPTPPADRAR